MRGYCPKCKEYRSDEGKDAWAIIWKDGLAICERCGSVIDLWVNECEAKSIQKMENRKSGQK
jgi:hypothetical protein